MLSSKEAKACCCAFLVGLVAVGLLLVGCAGNGSEQSRKYYELGRRLGKQGKYHEALDAFNKSLAADRNNAQAHNGLGLCYLLLGQERKGEQELKEALRLKPDFTKAARNLASLYQRQNRMKEAVPLLEQITDASPNDAKSWSFLMTAYMSEHQIEKALVAGKRSLELAPNDPTVIVNYANMQKQLTKLDEAEKYYKQVIDMNPPDEQVRSLAITGLFDVYFLRGEYAKAKVVALQAKNDFPNNFAVYTNLAMLYEKLNKNELASQNYDKAVELAPNNAVLLVRAGEFYDRTGKGKRAKEMYMKAIKVDPNSVDGYLHIIDNAINTGQGLAEAEAYCQKALSFANQYEKPKLLDQMAVLKRMLGDLDASVKYCKDALGSLPEKDKVGEAAIRVHLAETYREQKKFALTKKELEAALALSPPEPLIKEIETVSSKLPPQWVPDLGNTEPKSTEESSN